jgi:hypothetical protein
VTDRTEFVLVFALLVAVMAGAALFAAVMYANGGWFWAIVYSIALGLGFAWGIDVSAKRKVRRGRRF